MVMVKVRLSLLGCLQLKMLTLFTVLNPKMGGSEADQDVKERLVIRELFPSSALHIGLSMDYKFFKTTHPVVLSRWWCAHCK